MKNNAELDIINQLEALLALMDEPDEKIFHKVRNTILDLGESSIPFLEQALLETRSLDEYERLNDLIDDIGYRTMKKKLAEWLTGKQDDILEAWIIIAQFLNRDMNVNEVRHGYSKLRNDIWLEINDTLTALEKIRVINHVFYTVYGFGEAENRYDPLSCLPDTVLKLRKGTKITLSMLYLLTAQKLNLPVFGIDLPGHFILAYLDVPYRIKKLSPPDSSSEIMFYINPFNKGAVFTQNEVDLYLKQINYKGTHSDFPPCANSGLVTNFLIAAADIWKKEGKENKAGYLKELGNRFASFDTGKS